jgi:hypothetical protein
MSPGHLDPNSIFGRPDSIGEVAVAPPRARARSKRAKKLAQQRKGTGVQPIKDLLPLHGQVTYERVSPDHKELQTGLRIIGIIAITEVVIFHLGQLWNLLNQVIRSH